jgi:hypothetical protein
MNISGLGTESLYLHSFLSSVRKISSKHLFSDSGCIQRYFINYSYQNDSELNVGVEKN